MDLLFVFELINRAGRRFDVVALSQIGRLVNGSAFRERVEVADFDDAPRQGDRMVGRDRDASGSDEPVPPVKSEGDASSFSLRLTGHEGSARDELVLELILVAVAPRHVDGIHPLEDDAFGPFVFQPMEQSFLGAPTGDGFDPLEGRSTAAWNSRLEQDEPLAVRLTPKVGSSAAEQVEGRDRKSTRLNSSHVAISY